MDRILAARRFGRSLDHRGDRKVPTIDTQLLARSEREGNVLPCGILEGRNADRSGRVEFKYRRNQKLGPRMVRVDVELASDAEIQLHGRRSAGLDLYLAQ